MAGKLQILLVLCLLAPCPAQFEIRAGVATVATTADATTAVATTTAAATTVAATTAATTIAATTPAATTIAATTPAATTTAAPPTTDEAGVTTTAATTTAAPTTTNEAGVTTTAATTTAAPTTTNEAGVTTTAATTTAAPTTTSEAGGTGDTTTQPSGEATTGGTVATTEPQLTTESLDPCTSSPCGSGSTCEPRNDNSFVCLCLGGTYNYTTNSCEKAKVFPGELSLGKIEYHEKMSDKQSQEFKDTAETIVAEVAKGFKSNPDFSEAMVLELRPLSTRATGVKATVEIVFQADAEIDDETVKKAMENAAGCKDCVLSGATFTETSLCDSKPCEETSSTCSSADGSFTCTCRKGYIETDLSSKLCIAACPIGEEAKDGECVACSFGYSGFNCEESWKLVLTIVGSVLGGLLLVTLILLPVVALKSSKKTSKKSKEADIGMSQVNQPNTKAPMMTSNFSNASREPANGTANGFANTGMQRFPRATTNNNWESRTNLDMTPSNSRQNLIPASRTSRYDDDDDVAPYAQVRPQNSIYSQARSQSSLYDQTRPQSNPYAQTRPQSNPYAQTRPQSNPYEQTRPQSNPYAQTRPQSNPYASSQGQSSPYFAEDVGRRY